MATRPTTPVAADAPSYVGPFITVAVLFGIFGFLTALNSTLVEKLKEIFQAGNGRAMLVAASWFVAYLLFSVPAAKIIEQVGYKWTMVIALFVMVGGALLFIPAANLVSFNMTLFASFVLAAGVCALQTAANPYVSILGPEHSAPARLTLAQAFNSAGTALAPIMAGRFLLSHSDKAQSPAAAAHMLQGPYLAIAAALLILGVIVIFLHLPAIQSAGGRAVAAGDSIWRYKHTVLAMVGIFFYVGIEIALTAITIPYCKERGISNVETAGLMFSLFVLGMLAGRLAGSAIMAWIKASHLLVVLATCGVVLLLTSMATKGIVAVAALVLCGLACSVMYPTIFALGIAELGPMTSKGSGIINVGNVGGAILPPLSGLLADKLGIEFAFLLPIVGFLYVAYFGLSGYKPTRFSAR